MRDGVKTIQPTEQEKVGGAKKSTMAAKRISAGTRFADANLAVKRLGTGTSSSRHWGLLDQEATRDYERDEPIEQD